MSLPVLLWRLGAAAAAPVLPLLLRRRAARGKEVAARLSERFGEGAARPPGRLLWLHAASVGETASVLPVLEALAARAPQLSVLLTTGTVTAARLLEQRLPPALRGRVLHRFAPLDVPAWVGRFLAGWRPDAAAFVESELWPNLVLAARARGIPLALVNARLSARSARRWARAPGLARTVLGSFALVLAQSEADAARLAALGAPAPRCLGNLKDAAPPLPAAPEAMAALRAAVGARPVLLAASTHPGEEALAIAAHRLLAPRLPGLLTVLVPRHPERGAEVAAAAAGLAVARRAAGAMPGPEVAVYVADTLGELGLFYRLAGVAFVGGSLVPHGGQNPLEPARLGCPVLVGPHCWNFAEPVARLLGAGGALRIEGEDPAGALAEAAFTVLSDPARARAMAAAAAAAAATEAGLPARVAEALLALLGPDAAGGTIPDGRARALPSAPERIADGPGRERDSAP
ncbi:3-deoxy-D-manno-octulosonic acid transferase [Crenalkalicoccus roseus]|uniref:3-deoxy-D-manno-octulosonic acid transferase n=1 Tax=Crenalkalicoccus roseus TaxID=1485588 RepID=UPI00108062C0|nr:glycosyltransferase N-terminal domain-containing protein [Crenalkalicoccus roseus]